MRLGVVREWKHMCFQGGLCENTTTKHDNYQSVSQSSVSQTAEKKNHNVIPIIHHEEEGKVDVVGELKHNHRA
jgi:hypothetical protein